MILWWYWLPALAGLVATLYYHRQLWDFEEPTFWSQLLVTLIPGFNWLVLAGVLLEIYRERMDD